ncbi:MAG TPA: carboxypeptidase-like regulatory domain-containing protein, partial [Vicinamibacteria bacterium]
MSTLALALLLLAGPEKTPAPREAAPGTVTLPLADYDRLVERAAQPPRVLEAPPVPAVVGRAEARLRVADGTVRGTVALEGEVLQAGSALVPLLGGGLLLEARAGGRAVPLTTGSVPQAVLSGPGSFLLTLDWVAEVATEPGRASFVLPPTGARSTRVVVEVPGENADVRVEPGLVTRRGAAGGYTVVEAALERSSPTRVSWSARDSAPAARREAVLLGDIKTLLTVGEADLQLAALLDVTVVQGEPERFEVSLPDGFEVTGASGRTLESTARPRPRVLALVTAEPQRRRQQFLVTLEKTHPAAAGRESLQVPLPQLEGALRQTGEVAVVGAGTMEVAAPEAPPLKRMDPSEAGAALKSLTRQPVLAAFRYLRHATPAPVLALDVQRFPDAPVLAALAERAVATTLVTAEGRRLTEVTLTVQNQARPFLRVSLPAGATVLSAEVAGQPVKPLSGPDGARLPLLRPGFRPSGPYPVSFVFLEPGTALAKKGDGEVTLPRFDLPVGVLQWELFLPDKYRVKRFGGDALGSERWGASVPGETRRTSFVLDGVVGGVTGGLDADAGVPLEGLRAGQVGGTVTDPSGAPLPGATVSIPGTGASTVSRGDGTFALPPLPPGRYRLRCELTGFSAREHTVTVGPGGPRLVALRLDVAAVAETLTVNGEAPLLDMRSAASGATFRSDDRLEAGPGRKSAE